MPFKNKDFWSPEKYVTVDEIKSIVEKIAPLSPVKTRRNGPSKYFRLRDAKGVIGFISALTHHFCEDCNRLRLTSDGKLRPCLFSDTEIDLKPALRGNNSDYEIERLLRLAIEVKPKGHKIDKKPDIEFIRSMSQIGG
jgi:cyclic pyranopterin phosphate synthase